MRRFVLTLMLVGALAAVPVVPMAASGQPPCTGETDADGVRMAPGAPLRFGITPAGEAGAAGPAVPAAREVPRKTLHFLDLLNPPREPFYVRLNRFFWSAGRDGIEHFQKLTHRYASHGSRVELQLRYHPRPAQEGRIGRWAHFVRRVVRRFGPERHVKALQVTNEVNLTISPDSSDGAFDRARDALIRGVIAAHRAARRHGYDQLEIGFNWFYRTDPGSEQSFWDYLRDHGGARFVRRVDWVGLDAYPGTFFPPLEVGDGYRDAMVNAFSVLRDCFLPIPGIPSSVPIHVEENGYPTGDGRPYEEQVKAMRQMVGAAHDFHGTYDVSDYRWFDLRDHKTSSTNFQHHYGLLEDDYRRKPAFGVYRRVLRRLSG